MGRTLKALQTIEARSPGVTFTSPETALATVETLPEAEPPQPAVICEFPQPPESLPEETLPEETLPADLGPFQWPIHPSEDHARAYDELADKILSQLPTNQPAALMFTSPSDGTGSTALVVSLSAALAQRVPGKVLAVDANLRNPVLAAGLGIGAECGLADVLTGSASWAPLVRDTVVSGLSILPGGRLPRLGERPPEEVKLGPILEEMGREYALVLIDAASLAHGEVAPMASCCTGTYVIVRLNHTSLRAAGEAVKVVRSCGGRVLGAVVLD